MAQEAAARFREFEENGTPPAGSRLVAGVAEARGQQDVGEGDSAPAASMAASINQGAPPAATPASPPAAEESPLNPGELSGKAVNIAASNVDNVAELSDGRTGSVASRLTDLTDGGTGRISSRMPAAGSAGGIVGGAFALPGQIASVFDGKGDANQVLGEVSQAAGTTAALAKDTIEGSQNLLRGSARRSAAAAMRARLPNAPDSVIRAAAREAAEGALPESARRDLGVNRNGTRAQRATAISQEAARRAANPTYATQRASTRAASRAAQQSGSTVASTVGATNKKTAVKLLRQGGREAAEAATRSVARRAVLGTVARAGGRFVPGLNVAIAAADSATAYSTLRDPNASTGKKVTSVITAIGSVAAATNIPVVSQVGAAVSAVSGFVGSFF